MARELTREEKAAIRKLVTRLCANYDGMWAACRWTARAICWKSAGRGRCAVTSGRRCCPMIPCWRRPSLRKALPRKPGPARYVAGLFSPMAGHGIAPPAAPRPQGSKSSGAICGNTGGNALAFGPGKSACYKAFRGRFGRGQYLFPSAPVLRK